MISGTLFLTADLFAVISLAMPDWIISDVGGKCKCKDDIFFKYSSSKDTFFKEILDWV